MYSTNSGLIYSIIRHLTSHDVSSSLTVPVAIGQGVMVLN